MGASTCLVAADHGHLLEIVRRQKSAIHSAMSRATGRIQAQMVSGWTSDVARVYNLALRCPMHESRSHSELREIKTIHERYLRDYSAYMERYMHGCAAAGIAKRARRQHLRQRRSIKDLDCWDTPSIFMVKQKLYDVDGKCHKLPLNELHEAQTAIAENFRYKVMYPVLRNEGAVTRSQD